MVVSDEGGVYRDGNAWIMCLFALEEYRDWANRLAHPLLRPLARQGFALLSDQRSRISRWLSLASEREIAETLRGVSAPACATYQRWVQEKSMPNHRRRRRSPDSSGRSQTLTSPSLPPVTRVLPVETPPGTSPIPRAPGTWLSA